MNPSRVPLNPDADPSKEEWLSAMLDGHGDADTARAACEHWRQTAHVRQTWHAYQLIGDVLRSDELVSTGQRDAAFLARVRDRLAEEPVPLAPAPLIIPAPRHRRWLPPVAAVAGFVAVGAAVIVLRPEFAPRPAEDSAAAMATGTLSTGVPSEAPMMRVGSVARPASGQALLILDDQSIRDARLELYFEAHRGATVVAPSAVPGGGLRQTEALLPQR